MDGDGLRLAKVAIASDGKLEKAERTGKTETNGASRTFQQYDEALTNWKTIRADRIQELSQDGRSVYGLLSEGKAKVLEHNADNTTAEHESAALRLYNAAGERTGTAYRWDNKQDWRTPHAFTTEGQIVLFDAGQTYAGPALQGYGISLPTGFVQLGYIRVAEDGTVADLKVSGEEKEVKGGRPTFRTFRIWDELLGDWRTVLGPRVENLSTLKESVYAFPKEHKVEVERYGRLTEVWATELFTEEGRQAGTAYLVDERRGRWERTNAYNAEGYASFFAPGVELKGAAAGAYFSADGYQLGYLKADDTGAASVTEVAGEWANQGDALEYRTLFKRSPEGVELKKITVLKDTDLSNRMGQSIFVRPLDKRAAVTLPAKGGSREAKEVTAGDLFNGYGQRLGRAYDLEGNGRWAVTQAEDKEGYPLFLAPNERLTGKDASFARNLQGFQAERLEADETGGVWNVAVRRQSPDTAFLWKASAGDYIPVKGTRQTVDRKESIVFDLHETVTVHQLKSWAPGQPREWKTYDRKLILFEDGTSFTGSFDGKHYAPGTTLYDRRTQTWVFVPRSLINTDRAIHRLAGTYETGLFVLRDPSFVRGEFLIGENLGRIGVADSSVTGGVRWISQINQEVPAGFTRSARIGLKGQDGVAPFYPIVLRAREAEGKPILAMEPAEGVARISIVQTGFQVTALPEELQKSLALKRGTEFWVELDGSVYNGKVLGSSADGGWRAQVTKTEKVLVEQPMPRGMEELPDETYATKLRYLVGRDPGTGKLIFVEEGEAYLSQLLRDKSRYDGSKDPEGYSKSEAIPVVGVYATFRTAGLSQKEDVQYFKVQEDPATGAYQKQEEVLGELADIVGDGRFESVLVGAGVQSLKLKGSALERPDPAAKKISLAYTADLTNDPTKLTDFQKADGTPLAKGSRFYLLNRQRAQVSAADPRGSTLKIFDPQVSVTAEVERNLFTEFKILGASGEAAQEGLAVDPENSAHQERFTTVRGNDGVRFALAGAVVHFTILDSAGQDELSVTGRVILTHPEADFEVEAITPVGPKEQLHWGNLNDLARTDQTGELKLTQDGINAFFGIRPVLGLRVWKDQLVREKAGIELIQQPAGGIGNGLVHRRMTQPSSYEARVDGDWRKAHLMSYIPGYPNTRGLVLAELPHRVEPDHRGRVALAGSNTPGADGRLEIEHSGAFDWWLAKDGMTYYQGPLSGGQQIPMAIPSGGKEQPEGRILDAKGELVGVALPVALEGSERADGKLRFTRRINDAQIITVEGLAKEKPRLWLSGDLKGDLALRIPLHRSQLATRVYTDSYALPMTIGALGLSSLPGGLFQQIERVIFTSRAVPGEVELTRVSETNLKKPVELGVPTEYPLASLPYQKVHYQAGSRVVLHPSGAMWLADGLAQKSFVHEGKRVTVHYTSTQDTSLPMVISRVEDQDDRVLARYAYQGDQLYFEEPKEALALSQTLKALGDEFLLGWQVGTPDQRMEAPEPIIHTPYLLAGKLLLLEMENPQFKGVVPVIARVWIKLDGQVKERLGQFYDPANGRQGILADIEGQLVFKGVGDVWVMNDDHKLVLETKRESAPTAASPFGEPVVDEMDRLVSRLEEVGNEIDEWLNAQPDLYQIIREVKLAEDKETGLVLAQGEVTGGRLFSDFSGRYVYFRPGETKGGFYISQQDPILAPWEPEPKSTEIFYQFLPSSPKGPWIDVTKNPYAEKFKELLKRENIIIRVEEPTPEPTQPGVPTGGYESPLRHLGLWQEWLSDVQKKEGKGELQAEAIVDDFIPFMVTTSPSRAEEFKDRATVSGMLERVIGEIASLDPAALAKDHFQALGAHLAAKGPDEDVRPFMDFVKYIAYRNLPRNPKGFRDHQQGLSCVGVVETLTAIGRALGVEVSVMLTRGVDGRTDKAGHVMALWGGDALDFAIPQDGSDRDGTLWHNLEGVARKSGLADPRNEVQVLVLDSRTGKWGYQPFLALFDEEGNLKEDLRRNNEMPVGFKTEVVVAFESAKRYQLPELTDLMELSIQHMKGGDRQMAVLILTGEDVLHGIDYTQRILEGLLAVDEGKYQALEDLKPLHEFLQARRELVKGILDGTIVRLEDRNGQLVSISKDNAERRLLPNREFHPIVTPPFAAASPKPTQEKSLQEKSVSIYHGTDGLPYEVHQDRDGNVVLARLFGSYSTAGDEFLFQGLRAANENEKLGWLYDVKKKQLVKQAPTVADVKRSGESQAIALPVDLKQVVEQGDKKIYPFNKGETFAVPLPGLAGEMATVTVAQDFWAEVLGATEDQKMAVFSINALKGLEVKVSSRYGNNTHEANAVLDVMNDGQLYLSAPRTMTTTKESFIAYRRPDQGAAPGQGPPPQAPYGAGKIAEVSEETYLLTQNDAGELRILLNSADLSLVPFAEGSTWQVPASLQGRSTFLTTTIDAQGRFQVNADELIHSGIQRSASGNAYVAYVEVKGVGSDFLLFREENQKQTFLEADDTSVSFGEHLFKIDNNGTTLLSNEKLGTLKDYEIPGQKDQKADLDLFGFTADMKPAGLLHGRKDLILIQPKPSGETGSAQTLPAAMHSEKVTIDGNQIHVGEGATLAILGEQLLPFAANSKEITVIGKLAGLDGSIKLVLDVDGSGNRSATDAKLSLNLTDGRVVERSIDRTGKVSISALKDDVADGKLGEIKVQTGTAAIHLITNDKTKEKELLLEIDASKEPLKVPVEGMRAQRNGQPVTALLFEGKVQFSLTGSGELVTRDTLTMAVV